MNNCNECCAIALLKTADYEAADHFRGVTKMIDIGKGGQRPIDGFMLTRYGSVA